MSSLYHMPVMQQKPKVDFLTLPQTIENFNLRSTEPFFYGSKLGKYHRSEIWRRFIMILEQLLTPNYWTEGHIDYCLDVIEELLKQEVLSANAFVMKPRFFKWLLDNITPSGITRINRMLGKDVFRRQYCPFK